MLKSRACLMLLVLLYGCGGGGLNLPNVGNPPNVNPPTGYRVTVTLNMNQVYEGEEVICRVELSPSVQQVINWRQEPSSPSGTFSPLSGSVVRWRAPMVERATSFSLIACVVIQGKSYEGSASVIVLDKSEPPQEPPRISISYPLDDGKQNLVGEGTLLTIMGNVQAGSNPIQKIQVLEGSNVLQEWPVSSSGEFRVDLERFGVPGRKVLRLRIVDSVGLYSEQTITVTNDNSLLDEEARQFLKKYSCAGDGGTVRFGNLQTGPYAMPVKVYINSVQQWKDLIERACAFWSQYTGIQFEITTFTGSAEFPSIVIADYTNVDKPIVAETIRGYITDPHEIDATIRLYKGWLGYPDILKVDVLSHELGHALLTEQHIDEYGLWFVMSTWGGNAVRLLPCIAQKATRLLYEHAPGWKP